MKGISSRVFRGVALVGKAALFCLGLLAMLALVAMTTVLTPVVLMATALPATTMRQKRGPSGRRYGRGTPDLSAPRKAVAS